MGKWQYGIVLDAGSSGTRIHIYRWLDPARARKEGDAKKLHSLPAIETKKKWTKKIHPGIASFGARPDQVGDYLEPLLAHALEVIDPADVPNTPVFLLATAGMRLLPEQQRRNLLSEICEFTRENTKFQLPDCDLHVQVIPGETEGLYGWIAANYLLGGFDNPADHAHGKGHHTYGFLDMGGASAQIAFAPNATEAKKHAEDLTLLRLRTVDGLPSEYRVFVTTWLGFGVREARRRYVEALLEASGGAGVEELPDPCLPAGLTVTKEGKTIKPGSDEAKGKEPHLIGTGKFEECLRQTYPLLDKDMPCPDEPCLFKGVHVPAIDFDVNHFVGVSEYWHTTHEIFEMGHKEKAYDLQTYQARVAEFCSQKWGDIVNGVDAKKWGKKVDETTALEVCFKASWVINVLYDGIGIPRVGIEAGKHANGFNGTKEITEGAKDKGFTDSFQAVDKIDGTEVSWTLGKMVLYASSQVPPVNESGLAVGYGANEPGTPRDWHFPSIHGGNLPVALPSDDTVDEKDWHDSLFSGDNKRRIPGFLLLALVFLIIGLYLCGSNRRITLFHKLLALMGRTPPPSSKFRSRRRFRNRPDRSPQTFAKKLFSLGTSGPRNANQSYERVDQQAEGQMYDPAEFELGSIGSDSDIEANASDSSDSVSHNKVGRTSGWATPKLSHATASSTNLAAPGYFGDSGSGGSHGHGLGLGPPGALLNAMERGGLTVRTESRERLTPMVGLGPPSLSRSRQGSPTRKTLHGSKKSLD